MFRSFEEIENFVLQNRRTRVRIALAAACLLVFSLLYTPCVAAIASIKRELGTRWAVAVVVWQCALAWVAASIVHLVGLLLGVGL